MDDLQGSRAGALITGALAYFGGASLAGSIDLTQLLSAAISGVIAVAGWVLVAWLKHRWAEKRKERDAE